MSDSRRVAPPLGLIGLGLMGSALAGRLIRAGRDVAGFDLDEAKRRAMVRMGGRSAEIAAIVVECPIIVLALFDGRQVENVIENHVVPSLPPSSTRTIVCTSTCDPDALAMLAARVEPAGIFIVEAPISGTSAQVSQGSGVALIGGDPGLVDSVSDVLSALFATCHRVGRVGDGGRAKLAVNLILGLNRLALAEGLVFAERLGLAPERFLAIARESAAYSQCMDTKGPKMVSSDFAPQGKIAQSLKDFILVLEAGRRTGQTLPAAELNVAILTASMAAGDGELDNSAVIRELQRRGSSPASD